jgi:hypothetical protein
MICGWLRKICILSSLMNCSTIYSSFNNCFSIFFTAHMNPVTFYLNYAQKYLARKTLPYFPAPNYLMTWKSIIESFFPFEPYDLFPNEFYSRADLFSVPRKGLVMSGTFWLKFYPLSNFYKIGDWNFYNPGDWKGLNFWKPPSFSFYLSFKKAGGDSVLFCRSD